MNADLVDLVTRALSFGATRRRVADGLGDVALAAIIGGARVRVGPRELALRSFLMASAHGAGLMLVPVLAGLRGEHVASALAAAGHGGHAGHHGRLPPTRGRWSPPARPGGPAG